jgi:hypothetical protein
MYDFGKAKNNVGLKPNAVRQRMNDLGKAKNSVGLKPIAVRLSSTA